ncbi:hypothetical protein GQF42_36100 [Streptomyces broussonetiae]|uniref:Uncharacterized protein n=1 Tax=Streptomyces broussonetiae TaxID=2686304 RepID=A0A6I6N426_9ACTN|nr:hypothetical protein [Streptomyces broussonetiae]QHA07978.1 hypothetical protein GQF42_36100 [Streptomyces broussonetiae]
MTDTETTPTHAPGVPEVVEGDSPVNTGPVDVQYIDPDGARDDFRHMWGADWLQRLSRYDGRRSHSPSGPHESSHPRTPLANAARRTAGNLAAPTASPTWATVASARTSVTAIVAHWP